MQFVFTLQVRDNVDPVTNDQRDTEVAYVREQYASGSIRQIWSRADVPGACLLIEATDEGAARVIIEGLPLMKAYKLKVDTCVPLLPYRGFAMAGK